MSESYLGDITMFGGSFAPQGWALCDGQLLTVNEYPALFQLIGKTYGGDGKTNFALPDMRGRIPVQQGTVAFLGRMIGSERVVLEPKQIPSHTHPLAVGGAATGNTPKNSIPAETTGASYAMSSTPVNASPLAVSPVGAGMAHENMQPYLCINFIICLQGVFPSK